MVGIERNGMIVRAIRFQRGVRRIGMTGWTFKLNIDCSPSAPPLLKLNCSGTLMRSPTGFCDVFASSVVLSDSVPASCACAMCAVATIIAIHVIRMASGASKKRSLRAIT